EHLSRLLKTPASPIAIDVERAVSWFEQRERIALAGEQREAIRRAVVAKVLVITGGPGTGKTTLVNGIIRILERKHRRILLCAPTGRAARRLSETTGRVAKTIHRMLEFNPKAMAFTRDASRPLEADLVVVDEVSMVDTLLFMQLLRALPPRCQLVLVGDVDQLPSVGPGNILRDLIRSGVVEVVRLIEIFRQARESWIVVNAHRVNSGEIPIVGAGGRAGGTMEEGRDFFFIERSEPEEILATIRSLVSERIPARFRFDPVDDIQVLSPMQRGLLGTASLNAELQSLLNPGGEAPPADDPSKTAEAGRAGRRGPRSFRPGDKVMQIRNNYNLEVFNGDIGRIESVTTRGEERMWLVRFDDRRIGYRPSELDELVLAYACS
ncbi:MAG: AAA family ATPase, partial [Vicinamibacteria bacterium]